MKCVNCGHEIPEGSGFCENCGTIMSLDNINNDEVVDVYSSSEKTNRVNDDFMQYLENEEPGINDLYDGEVPDTETQEILDAVFEDSQQEEPDAESDEQASYEPAEEIADEEPVEEDDSDLEEMYITKRKSKKGVGVIVVLAIILISVVAAGVGIIKGYIKLPALPAIAQRTTSAEEKDSTKNDEKTESKKETKKTTKTEEETEETTEAEKETKDTTKAKETEKDEVNETTKAPVTTKVPVTTKAPITTKAPVTTKVPATTKAPVTTKVPATTKASVTTKVPATTKTPTETKESATTDRYGITDAKVKKPSNYLSKTSTVYVTAEGVILRNKPSKNSERVLYLSLGADVKVLAEENGYYYVYSNRYGVYGWVSKSYTSTSRPTSDKITTVSNLVSPDKKYKKPTIKYVSSASGLRLRKGPGSKYDVIKNIPNGYPVKVIGYSSKDSGWVYVIETTYGVLGWVSSAYIK